MTAPAQPSVTDRLQPTACFGKTPRHGDFVRHRVGPALRAFDEWAGRAVYQGRREPAFDAAYDAEAIVRFVWSPPRASVPLVGALAPSRDRSGRRYPFIVAAEAPGLACTSDAPECLAPFFDAAGALARDAARGLVDHYGLVERAAEIDAALPVAGSASLGRSLGAFGVSVWGDPEDERKPALFRSLLAVLRGAEDGLRFPLGATAAADARAWLTLVEHLAALGTSGRQASAFAVYEGGPAVGSPSLLAYTGAPHPNALLHLLVPGADADGAVELEQRREGAALPAGVAELLRDNGRSLSDLIRHL